MPEIIADKKVFTLHEVARSIQNTIANRYGSAFWVKAEMNKLNPYPHSGHSYPDLVQKEGNKVIAQMRALIWKQDFEQISQRFRENTQEEIRDGMNILFLGKLSYEPNYGLSIRIIDIDPSFTLGEMEREKRACIQRLKEENIFDLNKTIKLPLLPKRLAIISVESSKGYADFVKLTENRMKGYKIEHYLFPSLLQGDKSAELIMQQLQRIKKVAHHFDLVAIIRGGGGEIGLSIFNNYNLAKAIAQFPLPVFTGIGHATNLTVCEMVAHTNAITPSELADLLLEKFEYVLQKIGNAIKTISQANRILNNEKQLIKHLQFILKSNANTIQLAHKNEIIFLSKSIQYTTQQTLSKSNEQLSHFTKSLNNSASTILINRFSAVKNQLVPIKNLSNQLLLNSLNNINSYEKSVLLLHPEQVLKRGYSLTMINGKLLTDSHQTKTGDTIKTLLKNGSLESTIYTIEHKKTNNK